MIARIKRTVFVPDMTVGALLIALTREVLIEYNVPSEAIMFLNRSQNSLTFQWMDGEETQENIVDRTDT